jgi:VWFA-related protein
LKVSTRMVSLEVVARDREGHPVRGLTAKDFQITEQVAPKKDRHPQAISIFQAQDWAAIQAAKKEAEPLPTGVFSNLVNRQKAPVPPTVLLFDGINTDVISQMEVHHQMVKILSSIPADVPVAVFLMGNQLRLLQTFTTDPKLVREAAAKTMVVGQTSPDQDPIDDPDSLSASLETLPSDHLPPGALASLENFERQSFSFGLTVRMQKTLDALRSIARYLNGYPGRKNVLWISTSFPINFWPDNQGVGGIPSDLRDFQGSMQDVGASFMDAKIAIYPMDPGGVRTQSAFEASARMRRPSSGQSLGQQIQNEDTIRQGAQQVMSDLADQTGGRVCLNDNDLADCVKKAVDDASSYYELGYYPDTGNWQGEYHRITVKTTQPGVHLSYRGGYYAKPRGAEETAATPGAQDADPRLHQAACEDPLTSTAVLLMVREITPDQLDAAKYFLAIDAHMLTFAQPAAGTHELGISVAACTFDKTGQPLQYLQKNSLAKLNDQDFSVASKGITQTFQFLPKPGVARVRLLVRDTASGRIGSIDVPYAPPAKPTPTLMPEPAKP